MPAAVQSRPLDPGCRIDQLPFTGDVLEIVAAQILISCYTKLAQTRSYPGVDHRS